MYKHVKDPNILPPGKLMSLIIPQECFPFWAMDSITSLPENVGYNVYLYVWVSLLG